MTTASKLKTWPDERTEKMMLEDAALIESEFEPTSAGHETACHVKALLARVRELEVERDNLKRWVSDLQSGMYVNCVYCGHRYGPEDKVPASMAEALKAHVEQCPQHPMCSLRKQMDQARAELERTCRALDWPVAAAPDVHYRAESVMTTWKEAAAERDRLRNEVNLHRSKANGEYWAWQGDGEDYLESLVCPVLIGARNLREIIAKVEGKG